MRASARAQGRQPVARPRRRRRTAARSLADALAICLVFARSEPALYDSAAVRWLGRLLIETRAFSLSDADRSPGRYVKRLPPTGRPAAVQRELARLLTARGQASLLEGLA